VRIFEAGEAPSAEAICGYEFRGFNTPRIMALFGIRKFIKAFFVTEAAAFGCNTPAAQNGLDTEWQAKPHDTDPKRFGFFEVDPGEGGAGDHGPSHALFLDYGRGHNKWYELSRVLRDYLVRVDPGSDQLLLGKAYAVIGPLRIPVSFFLLERFRPIASPIELPDAGG
jgi:hypothetical protein